MNNSTQLPDFSNITYDNIEKNINALLEKNKEKTGTLINTILEPTWENFIEALSQLDNELAKAWGPISHLNSVMSSNELQEAHNACLPSLSQYATEMGQNKELFKLYKKISRNKSLNKTQKHIIDESLKNFKLAGVDLNNKDKEKFKLISTKLSELTSKFSDNILASNNEWYKLITDVKKLSGLPDASLALAKQLAKERGLDGYLINLDYPSLSPALMYCDNRELRFELYKAANTRGSDQGSHNIEYNNDSIMNEILTLRQEMAQLLGFENYAEMSVASKMAENTDDVINFLTELSEKSKKQAESELKELQDFAAKNGTTDLMPWDIAYFSEKQKESKYGISQEEVRKYFPEDKVIKGLFNIAETLYNIEIVAKNDISTWHKDVKVFEIKENKETIAVFYLDLYARQNKRGGAWMDSCLDRIKNDKIMQLPVAYLVCNFTPPIDGNPSLLTHYEVETLFHEFGHGLHHMLTKIDYPEVSGINGVEWDAVELPSQFMENFCWQRETLDLFAQHHETGEKIPDDLFNKMMKSKNYQSAMMMARQLEFSLFDFKVHQNFSSERGGDILKIMNEVRDEVAVVNPPEWHRFPNSFSHIFAGGYAAGYYSYKWAEVLSADVFSKFEKEGILNQKTGQSFLDNILSKGGSDKALQLFKNFMGREPNINALLRHSGISN